MAKVLVYPVGKDPQEQEINGLEDMQKIVGGYIQYVDLGTISQIPELDGYDLYCNEEGKLRGLPFNVMFPQDFMVGDFFISKSDEEGETVSLTQVDIETVTHHMERNGKKVLALHDRRIKNILGK